MASIRRTDDMALGFIAYAAEEPEPETFSIPEDLGTLSDGDLADLTEQAVGHFDSLYGEGDSLSDEEVNALSALTDAIQALNAEVEVRSAAQAERTAAAQALAAKVRGADSMSTEPVEEEPEVDENGEPVEAPEEGEEEQPENPATDAAQTVVASNRRIPLPARRTTGSFRPAPAGRATVSKPSGIKDVMFAADGKGKGIDFNGVGSIIDRSLSSYNHQAYAMAAARGQRLRDQTNIAVINKPVPADLIVRSSDPSHLEDVFSRAVDQSRLPGGSLLSLTASGTGWCAPSEILYGDFLELESRDGLVSLPEVGVSRGGFQFTTGPDFTDIWDGTGFCFTEDDDIAGRYARPDPDTDPTAANVVGDKPCYKVECPDFEEVRLGVCGICIQAGILQSRGYPEVIARTTRAAMVAHEHKMAGRYIAAIAAASTEVTMPTEQAGATAPLLTSIELQVEHYRYVHRMSRSAVLEAIFPFWVRGVIRSDLSRRLGVDLLNISDTVINGWFRDRGVAAQFVYNYQDITGDAAAFTEWPTEVEFLLYAAGTWVLGTSDVITLDTIYDSTLLAQNDYTALFTEEGWLLAQRGDSRAVTVGLCGDGATHGGIDIACDGTVAAGA